MSTIRQAVENLTKARALIADREQWTKFVFAKDKELNKVGFNEPRATCWCVAGAMGKVSGLVNPDLDGESVWSDIMDLPGWMHLRKSARELHDLEPETVNDRMGHSAILKVIDHAIAILEKQHANTTGS